MKGIICSGLSALILTTASVAIAAPAKYESQDLQSPPSIALNFNVPHISNSGIKNDTHFIEVEVLGMSLQDLMISVPSQMQRFSGVRVRDKSGRDIAAQTEINQGNLSIVFEQPLAPGNTVEVQFTGVKTTVPADKIILYGVTARRVGLQGEIPIGTARIDLPN
ncbi:DUF2808 domain-containing protein [Nostoc sp. MS1]|uniref:DUF2808 domain-containing protein n=1 Tax=Nostoc sp. MS1 TaxID=2764711 RepID=UPI001CC458A4|nr:DUF2808 domain-containing protein [Nostoc sp. MS1]BCL34486.1 hypothetical protein NSMS1_09330 [Nostoc sp. MS1]